jgi:hypothetical protein
MAVHATGQRKIRRQCGVTLFMAVSSSSILGAIRCGSRLLERPAAADFFVSRKIDEIYHIREISRLRPWSNPRLRQ